MADSLVGRRVLVVEDEMLIALVVEEALADCGVVVVGPVSTVDAALALAAAETLDAAVLDVTVRGGQTFPVAERLLARGVPFVLASGYGDWALPEGLRDRPRLVKPFKPQELQDRVRELCTRDPRPQRAERSSG